MAESLPASKGPIGRDPAQDAPRGALDRLAAFRVVYLAIFAFVLLSVISVERADDLLIPHFRGEVARAIRVSPADGPVVPQIQRRIDELTHRSAWTWLGGVQVDAIVIGADGTIIYSGGRAVPPPPTFDPVTVFLDAQRLLPASAETFVTVPVNSPLAIAIFIAYGAVLITGLFLYNRTLVRREEALIREAVAARNRTADRAAGIERELSLVRQRLAEVEPTEHARAEEVRALERERGTLRDKLADLAEREAKLRGTAERSLELEDERRALEDLLEEAMDDLEQKQDEIQKLETQLKRARKAPPSAGRGRASEQLARRLRTLYPNLDFDERAIDDLIALRDETMKLKAEQVIKRLADDSSTAATRRKVGGLPPHLSIFELGFAGKGRIYYSRVGQQRFQILAVGAKNTQNADLEYLSRLAK